MHWLTAQIKKEEPEATIKNITEQEKTLIHVKQREFEWKKREATLSNANKRE